MTKARLSEEDKRNIVTACNAGAKATDVAEKYGISKGTVWNIVSEWKKHGESSFAETEETEKEPATAGTVTSSEEESVVTNISAPIIAETVEDVKPVIPDSVFEAVNRYRDDLKKDIAEHESYIDDLKGQLAELEEFIARRGT